MCGVAGIVSTSSVLTVEAAVTRMISSIAHRGPDHSAVSFLGMAVLGHTRLRIIDLSPEADEPLPNEDGTVWLSFNGEIFNWKQIRSGLVSKGHSFRSQCDAEVIVHLYEESGNGFVGKLEGIFAFAVWDQEARRLLLSRDRLGIKPLYYAEIPDGIMFASEIRALVASGLVPSLLNKSALRDVLRFGSVGSDRTAVSGIQELPAGHMLEWRDGHLDITAYWQPRIEVNPALSDSKDAVTNLRGRLEQAVGRQLVADVPLGVFLSSGIDSAVVASVAGALGGSLKTFTISVGGADDEGQMAASLAHHLGSDHTQVTLDQDDALEGVLRSISAMDQPTVDGVNTWMVAKAARESGLVVALSGLGGDELFFGYPTFRVIPELMSVARLASYLPKRMRNALSSMAFGRLDGPLRRVTAFLGGPMGVTEAYEMLREVLPTELVFTTEAVAHPPADSKVNILHETCLLELGRYMRNQLLRDSDQMGMAHSVEIRVPLLDELVVDLAFAIPASLKAPNGRPKQLLIHAVADLLPPGYGSGEKKTFTLPFDRWLRGPLRDVSKGALLSDDSVLTTLMPPQSRERLWTEFDRGRLHWSRVWAPVVVDLWTRSRGWTLNGA